jgi:hypothetical protein
MAMDSDAMHDVSMLTHLEDGCTFHNPLVDSSRPTKINNGDKNLEVHKPWFI